MSNQNNLRQLPAINLNSIQDQNVRQAFRALVLHLMADTAMLGFQHRTFSFPRTGTFKIPHTLGFQPLDLIQTSLTGPGTLTWNYTLFDATNLSVTVSDNTAAISSTNPMVVRLYLGTHFQGSTS